MKSLFLLLLACGAYSLKAQSGDTFAIPSSCPLKKGFLVTCNNRLLDHGRQKGDLLLISKADKEYDSVFSFIKGTVVSVDSIAGRWMIIIKRKRLTAAYINLTNTAVKSGEELVVGQYLGKLIDKEGSFFNLEMVLIDEGLHYFTGHDFLKRITRLVKE